MSEFVELDRSFVPLHEGQEPILQTDRAAGRKYHGWLSWTDLLALPRCVVLAEAGAGKTKELKARRDRLTAEGKFAFFLRIEDLADDAIDSCLSPEELRRLEKWEAGFEIAHFFLDSVDEARLSGKKLHTALRRFARGLSDRLPRARVLITCRVSDWLWEMDLAEIHKALPYRQTASNEDEELSPEDRLLRPLFPEDGAEAKTEAGERPTEGEITVVMLAPLSRVERRPLLESRHVADVAAFEDAIVRHGLESFADRPGDVIDMAGYWNENGRFGSRREMTDYAIGLRLKELDPHRPNSREVSPERLRAGAERIAAALTLAKRFTLRAPGGTVDDRPGADVLDPFEILPDWNRADVESLLTRGLFAPATYGRIRFHHRDSQEFLTAAWLERVWDDPRGATAVRRLLFVERYGEATVVPSLTPAAAWLAGRKPAVFDELLRRSPVDLIRHGDPRAIPLADKERLLRSYAALHARGNIGDDSLHWTAVAMFAVPDLHAGIRAVWDENRRDDFRLDLLRMIRDGKIVGAVDLAVSVVGDVGAAEGLRLVAADAIEACGSAEGLDLLARLLTAEGAGLTARLAARFALYSFPDRIDVETLFHVVARFPNGRSSFDSFEYSLPQFWARCAIDARRRLFMARLAELCLANPFVSDWQRISARHHDLASAARGIAADAIARFASPLDPALVRLLMAAERADRRLSYDGAEPPNLGDLISRHAPLKRALFWSDIEEERQNTDHGPRIVRHWHFGHGIARLWSLGAEDETWLEADTLGRPLEADRRLALSCLMSIIDSTRWPTWTEVERVRIAAHPELLADLEDALAPPPEPSAEQKKFQREEAAWKAEAARQEERNKQAWLELRDKLCACPDMLKDASLLTEWSGQVNLFDLSRWLKVAKQPGEREGSSSKWQRLASPFSPAVAEAYRDGMCLVWRLLPPVRPTRKGTGSRRLYTSGLAFDGLLLEASLGPNWHVHLSDELIEQAVRHVCLGEEAIPEFFGALVETHRELSVPIIEEALAHEWALPNEFGAFLMNHVAYDNGPLVRHVVGPLLTHLAGTPPGHENRCGLAVRILARAVLGPSERAALLAMLGAEEAPSGNWWRQRPDLHIALLFLADRDRAVDLFTTRLEYLRTGGDDAAAYALLNAFFGDRDNDLGGAADLDGVGVGRLEALVLAAYRAVRREDDNVHDGMFKPDARDHAERARSAILGELLGRPGQDAWAAVRRLADTPGMEASRLRFLELARRKADRDAELAAWHPLEVRDFETKCLAPAKTGAELFDLAKAILEEIADDLTSADASSRSLLQAAQEEEPVQLWLAEQLRLRSSDRYSVHREPIVADKKEPDIVLTTAAGMAQVAIEIKHGGKGWSGADLAAALRDQLVGRYLKIAARRHGILVVTNHDSKRRWRNPGTGETIDFAGLLDMLRSEAASSFSDGAVATAAGLDAAGPVAGKTGAAVGLDSTVP